MTKPALAKQMPDGSRRYYHPLTGEIYPSVTTVLDVIAKPALIPWAARMAATYASDNWQELSELEPTVRIAEIKAAHEREAGYAAEKGDVIHDLIDSWAKGTPGADYPKNLDSFVNQFISFMTTMRPVFLENEVTLLSRKHGFAGTCDWIAEIGGVTVLGDNKTGKKVYPEAALQLSALANCDCILRENGAEEMIPQFGKLMILHIRPRSWKLYEVTARVAAFQTFLAARNIWDWNNEIADESLKLVSP